MLGATSGQIDKERGNVEDEIYRSFLSDFEADVLGSAEKSPLFRTDATGLWDAYLASFSDGERQSHNCSACRRFVERYGGLVRISERGETTSVMWEKDAKRADYEPGFRAMRALVKRAKVTGVFLSKAPVLGHSLTGVWRHFSLKCPVGCAAEAGVLTPHQQMAAKKEDHANVLRALVEFPASAVDRALTLLKSDSLYRSEKVLGQAEWLHKLHVAWGATKGDRRTNVVWLAVATAPAGFCHPRSSMIGTLLQDIVAGLPFGEVSNKFRDKMQPDRYQRPQAAPSAGAIAHAERLVEQLGIAPSFERRFARLDEVQALWKPASEESAKGGVFGHLKPKGSQKESQLVASAQAITWEKFSRTVLPEARGLQFHVPSRGNFCALLTAVHPDAPPIHQWDSLEKRNPVSHYVYVGGSEASQWGLTVGLCEVTAIALSPWQWFNATCEHQGKAAVFLLKGARDGRTGQGNALFPEMLRSDLHGVRAVIEAYSKTAEIGGREQASACGYHLGTRGEVTVRVRNANGIQLDYRIDRWD
jgi:hypothetical protein